MNQRCQRCSERANLHITEVDGEEFEELHLCVKCAEKYMQQGKSGATPVIGEPSEEDESADVADCAVCGITFRDFQSTGRLGCPQDYQVFRNELLPLLESVHGAVRHVGKVPRRLPADAQLQARLLKLRQQLQQAVATEEYELAAQLRDQIDSLERQLHSRK